MNKSLELPQLGGRFVSVVKYRTPIDGTGKPVGVSCPLHSHQGYCSYVQGGEALVFLLEERKWISLRAEDCHLVDEDQIDQRFLIGLHITFVVGDSPRLGVIHGAYRHRVGAPLMLSVDVVSHLQQTASEIQVHDVPFVSATLKFS